MLGEAPRAFLRHAVAVYYADVTRVSTEGALFSWQAAFHWTLIKFRSAVLRWAVAIKRQAAHRYYTGLTGHVSEQTAQQFEQFVSFELPAYDIRLAPAFTASISAAKAALDAHMAEQQQRQQQRRVAQRRT